MLPAVTVETEASQMLEAALEQMDDIIAGKWHACIAGKSQSHLYSYAVHAWQTA